jgi:hypothetical protein
MTEYSRVHWDTTGQTVNDTNYGFNSTAYVNLQPDTIQHNVGSRWDGADYYLKINAGEEWSLIFELEVAVATFISPTWGYTTLTSPIQFYMDILIKENISGREIVKNTAVSYYQRQIDDVEFYAITIVEVSEVYLAEENSEIIIQARVPSGQGVGIIPDKFSSRFTAKRLR